MEQLERERNALLARMVSGLRSDDRFPAAWLAGSFGRQEEDEYSDLDVIVAVSEDAVEALCSSDRPTGAGSPGPRMDLISSFGTPAIVHEQHANAPPGGAFTAVIYESGTAVDWTFVPLLGLTRPSSTHFLFDQIDVPMEDASGQLDPATLAKRLGERLSFFWLLSISAAKAWRRGDDVRFHSVLELMYGARRDIEFLLRGERPVYTRYSLAPFLASREEQKRSLKEVCVEVNGLARSVARSGAATPDSPLEPVKRWLDL